MNCWLWQVFTYDPRGSIAMPFGPIKRIKLVKALKQAGFEGLFTGGNHEFLVKGELRLVLPTPH